jgi:imidazolonepropionase-like amidohydrolase
MAYRIRGTVLPDGDVREVFVVDGRFTFTGNDDATTLLDDGILLPGLVDMHAHLSMEAAHTGADPRETAEASARQHLEAGVLLVREPGSPHHVSKGIGPAIGLPRVLSAGRFLATPSEYIAGIAREVTDDQAPDAAEEELAAGWGWVKVIGDSMGAAPRLTRTFAQETLHELAARVHGLGGRIAIHCMHPDVIDDAIEAGFDSLEHGTSLRLDQVRPAAERGIAWVPTRSIDGLIREAIRDANYPSIEIDRVEGALARQPEVLQAAVEAGVTVLAGTDAPAIQHGEVRREVELLIEAGLSPIVAIGAASWTARSFLGMPGIEEGAPADLVAFRDDPRDDAAVLASPALTILDGVVTTGPTDRR